jgi:hypothetical protein
MTMPASFGSIREYQTDQPSTQITQAAPRLARTTTQETKGAASIELATPLED